VYGDVDCARLPIGVEALAAPPHAVTPCAVVALNASVDDLKARARDGLNRSHYLRARWARAASHAR
jgi:hypothetical protein